MVPTFFGRIQSRLFALGLMGLLWTLVITPALTVFGPSISDLYRATLFSWLAALVLGLFIWEPIYHGLMQFRWEKDWPTLFLAVESITEGLLVWLVRVAIGPDAPADVFLLHFFSTWLVVFLTLEGPMRVVFIRWRFRGGRII